MASTKETFLRFIKNDSKFSISPEDIGIAFKQGNKIIFVPLDEEFNDQGEIGTHIISSAVDATRSTGGTRTYYIR